jgi:predicted nuclease of predicted toxin-antitoxin system
MRFLANENISTRVILGLRNLGHDVLSAKESMPSASDEKILIHAESENRIVVTHDKDFGELAYRWGLPPGGGIILLRLQKRSPESDNLRILDALQSDIKWEGHFSVVTDNQIRCRPLPPQRIS